MKLSFLLQNAQSGEYAEVLVVYLHAVVGRFHTSIPQISEVTLPYLSEKYCIYCMYDNVFLNSKIAQPVQKY